MAFSLNNLFLPLCKLKERVQKLFDRSVPQPADSPISEAINEGSIAINTPVPSEKLSHARLHALVNPEADRAHQLDKLRRTSKDIGIPQSSKEVWFGQDTGKFDPLLLASQDETHRNKRNSRLSQANLTSTRLRALAETMEKHSDI